MKVYLNNYRHHWLSPYTIIDCLFFLDGLVTLPSRQKLGTRHVKFRT